MDNPKVSIIVPIYNVEKYLARCLDSLINQTFEDIEIIAINDGSTDNSLNILKDYENRDNRIKVIDKKNEGVSESRNKGIEYANGKYVTFVDSDDWIDYEMICELYNISEFQNSDVTLSTYIREYKDHSKIKKLNLDYETIYNEHEVKNLVYRKLVGPIGDELKNPDQVDTLVIPVAKLYKTSILKENDFKFIDLEEIGVGEDCLFNLDVFSRCNKVVIVNKPFYHYWKDNENSLTTVYKQDLSIKWRNFYRYIEISLRENNAEDIFYKALKNRVCITTLGLGLNECSKSNSVSQITKIKNLKKILNEDYINNSFKSFDLNNLVFHWRIFYFFCKNRLALPTYLMIKAINFLRQKV